MNDSVENCFGHSTISRNNSVRIKNYCQFFRDQTVNIDANVIKRIKNIECPCRNLGFVKRLFLKNCEKTKDKESFRVEIYQLLQTHKI